jgi:hypothetical protein
MLSDKGSFSRRAFVIVAISVFAAVGSSPCRSLLVNAQEADLPPSAPVATYQSHSLEEDHAHSEATHHYSSEADRAKDALLITEVKTVLASDGVTDGHAVVVDCDIVIMVPLYWLEQSARQPTPNVLLQLLPELTASSQ